jgi:hypothetical protein
VFFDELLERVRQRVTAYQRSHRPDILLSGEALVDADEMWQAAQPADPAHITPQDRQRLEAARQALADLDQAIENSTAKLAWQLGDLDQAIESRNTAVERRSVDQPGVLSILFDADPRQFERRGKRRGMRVYFDRAWYLDRRPHVSTARE